VGLDPTSPAPLLGRGRGAGGQAGEGGTRQGWGHAGGQAEPSHPLPARWQPGEDVRPSVCLQPEGHRPLAPLHNRPTRQMSQQRSKINKQQLQLLGFLVLTHYGLILETRLSVATGLPVGENPLPAQPDQQPPALRDEV